MTNRDWCDEHVSIPRWGWRQRIAYACYVIGDWITRDRCHTIELRNGSGQRIFTVNSRCPSISMPHFPFSVWCCGGRLDDGKGGCR